MYSPTQGRFTTIDPTGFQAGDVNLYRFVGNDPTNRVDPSGLAEVPGAWPAADSIRTEPKYTKHDVEWYATLFNVTNPDKPRIALASYFGFDVEVKNGQPALKKTPVAGVDVTGPRDSKLTILSNYVTRTKEVGGQKYLVVKYAILVTDKANDKYNAHLFANWQFSVTGNKLVSEFLGDDVFEKDPATFQWKPRLEEGKSNQELYTKYWQDISGPLYGPMKK